MASAFIVTFYLRSGREVKTPIFEREDFLSDEEVHAEIKDNIDTRDTGIWKGFGDVTLLFNQIDGWKVEEFATDQSAKLAQRG